MDTELSDLEITLHLTDGRRTRFGRIAAQDADKILGQIQPARFFEQRHLIIAGSHSLTVYPPRAVTHVEVDCDPYPDWPWPPEFKEIAELSEEEFRYRYRPQDQALPTREEREADTGDTQVNLLGIELVNKRIIYAELSVSVESKLDQRQIGMILSMPALHMKRKGGGAILINTAHIVRVGFYPGPADAPPAAWPAHHMPLK